MTHNHSNQPPEPKKQSAKTNWVEHSKTVAILLLFALALVLTTRIEAFTRLSTALNENNPQGTILEDGTPLEQSGGILPLAIVTHTQGEAGTYQYGVQYHQEEVTAAFEATSNLVREAMSGLASPQAIEEEDFLQAISQTPSLYYDLLGEIPLSIFYAGLSGQESDNVALSGSASRLALAPWQEGVAFYFQQEGAYYLAPVANLTQSRLATALEPFGENQVTFAFQERDYPHLHPLTLMQGEPLAPLVYASTTPFAEETGREELLKILEFPLSNHAQYTTSDGLVIRIGTDSLRLSHNGTVAYTSETATRYTLPLSANPTLYQQAEACRQFAQHLLQNLPLTPQLHLTAVAQPEGETTIFSFDYSLGGIPLTHPQGLPGAQFTVVGDQIHSFTLHYRNYTPPDIPTPVLPYLQAQAILQGLGVSQGELLLVYQDSGGEFLISNWLHPE